MTMVALASVKGSPGVTTCAIGLATTWGQPAVVIECDPAGGDAAPYLGMGTAPGLVSLAAVARHSPDIDQLWRHCQPAGEDLWVVPAPVGAVQARISARTFADSAMLDGLATARDAVAFVDCGRLDGDTVLPVLERAAVTVLLARPRPADLAHVAARAAELGQLGAGPTFLVLREPGGFSADEITQTLGLRILAAIPHDPAGAGMVFARPKPRRASRLPFPRAVRNLAARLQRELASAAVDQVEETASGAERTVPPSGWLSASPASPHAVEPETVPGIGPEAGRSGR